MLTVNLDKALKDLGANAGGRTDYQVFVSLAEYMDGNGVSTVRQSVISQETGYATRTVGNSIHRLAEKGFLTIGKTAINTKGIVSNVYRIDSKYLLETQDAAPCSAGAQPSRSKTDMRRLSHDMTRLHDVLVDVVADILEAAEERNNK